MSDFAVAVAEIAVELLDHGGWQDDIDGESAMVCRAPWLMV